MKFREIFQILNEAPFHDPEMFHSNVLNHADTIYNNGEYMKFAKSYTKMPDTVSYNGLTFRLKRKKTGNLIDDVFYFNEQVVGAIICYEKKGNLIQTSTTWQNKRFKGLARHLYLEYYLSRYPCIISGDEQSSFGRGMWVKLMDAAFSKNKKVGVVNMVTGERYNIKSIKDAERYYIGKYRNFNLTICN